ncbi:MAG: DUF4435 domain-containing protein [bacterium]|nr:DUF4435 domain-containing protein [bacterium]
MNNLYHPLRSNSRWILVCEGKGDATFLSQIISLFEPDIRIYHANGKQNVKPLRNVLIPAVSVIDRDFDILPEEAEQSNQSSQSHYWIRHDIEGYLIYPDWLWQFIEAIRPQQNSKYLPHDKNVIQTHLIEAAKNLIPDHAGRHTLMWLTQQLNLSRLQVALSNHIIGNAGFNNASDWENEIKHHIQKLNSFDLVTSIKQIDIYQQYRQLTDYYSQMAQSIETIQKNFSGKRLLAILASNWMIKARNQKSSQDFIRDTVVSYASNHAKFIKSQNQRLSDDPRLGDFGRLASKITGREV